MMKSSDDDNVEILSTLSNSSFHKVKDSRVIGYDGKRSRVTEGYSMLCIFQL